MNSRAYSSFSHRDLSVLLEEITNIFSETSHRYSLVASLSWGKAGVQFVVLLGDDGYFSE